MSKLALVVVLTVSLSVVSNGKSRLCHLLDDTVLFLAQYEERCPWKVLEAARYPSNGVATGLNITYINGNERTESFSKNDGAKTIGGEPVPLSSYEGTHSVWNGVNCSATLSNSPKVNPIQKRESLTVYFPGFRIHNGCVLQDESTTVSDGVPQR